MLRGKTTTGFEFELEDEVMDDYELLELLQGIDEGKTGLTIKMVEKLLGKEQKERLKDHVRSETGNVSARKILEEVTDIFKCTNEGKNS